MKKIIFILTISILLFFSCKQDNKQTVKEPENLVINKTDNKLITITKIDSSQFPKSIKYEGFIKNAVRWTDKSGDNIVLTTETGLFRNEKIKHDYDEGTDAELFAYHYTIKNNEAVLDWKVYDFVHDCPVDIVASLVKNTFEITDLDENGIAEIWLMYHTVCHNDVSPCNMKIIMYEANNKFAMRGVNKIPFGENENGEKIFDGGQYIADKAFENGPKVFKTFAQNLWNKNISVNCDN